MDSASEATSDDSKKVPDHPELPEASRRFLSSYDWTTDDIEHLCEAVLAAQAEIAELPVEYSKGDMRMVQWWKAIDNHIYRVLAATTRLCLLRPLPTRAPLADSNIISWITQRGENSDLDDDEVDGLFPELNTTLFKFGLAPDRSFLVIPPLPSRQRRHVHAIAHFSHMGHMSVGSGSLRMLLLSRKSSDLPSSLKKAYKEVRTGQTTESCQAFNESVLSGRAGRNRSGSLRSVSSPKALPATVANDERPLFAPDDFSDRHGPVLSPAIRDVSQHRYSFSASGYTSAGSMGGYSSHMSFSSAASGLSNAESFGESLMSRKRRREAGAFPCTEEGCSETFDRHCDLSHHQRRHLPYEQRPYACADCSQRFLYPKDLRRHSRTHAE